jgi:hypothetical protein
MIILVVVLTIALVGGVWALSAQGTVPDPPDPPDPAVPIPLGVGGPEGVCGAFDAGEAGGKRLVMADFPDCTPPVQATCPVGTTTEQFMPASLVALRFVYDGPFHQTCFLYPASEGVPQIGVISG